MSGSFQEAGENHLGSQVAFHFKSCWLYFSHARAKIWISWSSLRWEICFKILFLGKVLGLNPISILIIVSNKKIKNTCQMLDDF